MLIEQDPLAGTLPLLKGTKLTFASVPFQDPPHVVVTLGEFAVVKPNGKFTPPFRFVRVVAFGLPKVNLNVDTLLPAMMLLGVKEAMSAGAESDVPLDWMFSVNGLLPPLWVTCSVPLAGPTPGGVNWIWMEQLLFGASEAPQEFCEIVNGPVVEKPVRLVVVDPMFLIEAPPIA